MQTADVCVDQAVEQSTQYVFIALPRRPRPRMTEEEKERDKPGVISLVRPSQRGKFSVTRRMSSLLCNNFNRLWVMCQNRMRAGTAYTHWLLHHDDITPDRLYADILIDEMDSHGADVCSAVVPIKDSRYLTSTGIRNCETGEIRRLSMREVMRLPETFDLEDVLAAGIDIEGNRDDKILVVNTGLLMCRLDRDWCKRFPGFQMQEQIRPTAQGDELEAVCFSEDWLFSEWAATRGVKLLATRKAGLAHVDDDGTEYRNDRDPPEGAWGRDQGDDPKV